MTDASSFEVRLSRPLLLMIIAVGLVFLAAGLDLAVTHVVFDASFGEGSPIGRWAFQIFAIGIGGVIVLNCFWYLLFPARMLRIDRDNVTFGTGFRYRPFSIPTRFLQGGEIGMRESMVEVNGQRKQVKGGAVLKFRASGEIPAQKATSMGLQYYQHELAVSSLYGNRKPEEIVEGVRPFVSRLSR